jgi:3-phenylpropionate/trans-cinnamate dioxygenase ferredoxin reductase subunit
MTAGYVIAGASLAGAKGAQALREAGYGGPLVLIGDETEAPYERPPLSEGYLLGQAERASSTCIRRRGMPATTLTCA